MPSRKKPFFIVGCPRSGTTLLQVLLEQHPDIAIPPESFLFDRFGSIFHTYGNLQHPNNLRRLVRDLLRDERIRDWKLEINAEEFCARSFERSVAGVVSELFRIFAERHNKSHWGDKTPHHALCLPSIMSVFPEARIIHLVRDGRDVAESMTRIFIGPKSIYGIARRWLLFVTTVHEFGLTNPDRVLEVRYEDLVEKPEEIRRNIFLFIGADPGECPPLGNTLPDTPSRRQALQAVEHHASLKATISRAKIGVFKSRFSPREIGWFEAVARTGLELYGYKLLTDGTQKPSSLRRLAFWFQDGTVRYLRKFWQPRAFELLAKEIRLACQDRWRKLRRSSH